MTLTERLLRLVYRPVGAIAGLLAALLARTLFRRLWAALPGTPSPPRSSDRTRSLGEVVAAAALEGAVLGGVKALVERASTAGFAWLTGVWPGARNDEG